MILNLTDAQAFQLKRLLAQAIATSDIGADLVDRLGFDDMGELIAICEAAGWDEAEMQALADADAEEPLFPNKHIGRL